MDFEDMAAKVQAMLKQSLDAFVKLDARIARKVCSADDEVDRINRDMHQTVKTAIQENPTPENINVMIHLLCVSRHLERIADLSTNIAEDLIYLIEGRIVRHAAESFNGQA